MGGGCSTRRLDKAPCRDTWELGTEGWSAGGDRRVGVTASPGGGAFTRREVVSGCRAVSRGGVCEALARPLWV